MTDPKKRKRNTASPAPRHLKTPEAPQRSTRGERTAAHRGDRRAAKTRAPELELRPARSAHRPPEYSGKRLYDEKLLPYAEERHQANQRSLRRGIGWLFALPVILLIVQKLTGQSKIGILLIWIIGMFIISSALVYIAYSDHELQSYLRSLAEFVPDVEEPSLGSLLPVDEEGNWVISGEQLRRALSQSRVERKGKDVSIRLPHELVLNALQRGEEGRHEKRTAHRP